MFNSNTTARLLFVLKFREISNLINDLDERWQFQFKFPTASELIKLLFTVFIVAHTFACGFHLVAY